MGNSTDKDVAPADKKRSGATSAITPDLKVDAISPSSEKKNMLETMEKLLHWAAIVESTDDAIISKSTDGTITSWNRGAEKLFGYSPDEIIGKHISTLIPADKEDDFPVIMGHLKKGRKIDQFETQRVTKDGRIVDVSLTVSPLRDSDGNVIGASKIARDVTERKEYERRRDEFVSTASHELKTPITSQKIYGELLEKVIRENEDDHYLKYVKKINDQTQKLTNLINDLLELTQVQSGMLELQKQTFSLCELIEEVSEDLDHTTDHSIHFEAGEDCRIFGDRDRIGQVVMNLLSNAIKYSPRNSQIDITFRQEKEEVEVAIHDSGIGIPEKYQERIFERFFRVLGRDETTYPGMGIGLNFCREIINRHDGKIWVESELGDGSTFRFILPVVPNEK